MAELDSIDYLFVAPSASVHRIQEAQTTMYNVLWELCQDALGASSPGGSAEARQPMTGQLLIAGVGNIFLGDDGFGVEVAGRLRPSRPARLGAGRRLRHPGHAPGLRPGRLQLRDPGRRDRPRRRDRARST